MFRPLQSLQEKANRSNCYGRLLEKLYLFWSELLLNYSNDMSTPTNAARGLWQTEGLEWPGWALTGIGILGFTFTLPMTRLALQAFDPITIAVVRGAGAGLAALVCLALSRDTFPTRDQIVRMFYAGLGIVIFFPLLISIGLQFVPATHAGVVQSILPLATAFFGVVRGREKASRGFWISAILGAVLVAAFCQFRSRIGSIGIADIFVVLSFISCAYGYAEGALVTRELGGWKTICWILVIMLPLNLLGFLIYSLTHGLWRVPPSGEAWTGLTYLALVSQFLAFYFFYKGLALGGVAKMSQLQLLSPFLSIYAAHLVLGEVVDATVIVGAVLITAIVVAGRLSLRRG